MWVALRMDVFKGCWVQKPVYKNRLFFETIKQNGVFDPGQMPDKTFHLVRPRLEL